MLRFLTILHLHMLRDLCKHGYLHMLRTRSFGNEWTEGSETAFSHFLLSSHPLCCSQSPAYSQGISFYMSFCLLCSVVFYQVFLTAGVVICPPLGARPCRERTASEARHLN